MGVMYAADCPCGYESGDLFVGLGMTGYDAARELARCDHCHNMVTVRALSKRKRCPKCSRKVQIIHVDEDIATAEDLGFRTLECPLCRNDTMKLYEVGLWD